MNSFSLSQPQARGFDPVPQFAPSDLHRPHSRAALRAWSLLETARVFTLAVVALVFVSLLPLTHCAVAASPHWATIDGGGGTSRGAVGTLHGTIGQFDAGTLRGAAGTLEGGFWPGVQGGSTGNQITISGRITAPGGGALSGVHVVLGGTISLSTQTDAEGEFAFSGLPSGGSYSVAPFRPDLKFQPSRRDLEGVTTDIVLQFVGSPETVAPPPIQQAAKPSGIELRLNRVIYGIGETISATLDLGSYLVSVDQLHVVVSAPGSGDLELLTLSRLSSSRFVSANTISIGPVAGAGSVRVMDGELLLGPGEQFVAMWYADHLTPGQPALEEAMVWDFGLRADPQATGAAVQVVAGVAMTEDELNVPPGGKPIGTLISEDGMAVQLPLNELIFFPENDEQLERFLQESGGSVVGTDVLPGENRLPSSYLIRINTQAASLGNLEQMRLLLGESGKLFASSEAVLRLYALGLHYVLEGYNVAVNPRLQFAGVPSPSATERGNVMPNMRLSGPLNIPRLWAFLALWDADLARIPMAVLDMGFAPNPDFRVPRGGLIECDMEGGASVLGFVCGPGTATGPPTVGNSLFGDASWHGNGVVTTAGGVINNAWGSAGTGGQVVVPMLYRFGLASYAFEIGLGIRLAVNQGAAVINISAGYPCRIITTLGAEPDICTPEGRLALCATVTAPLAAAAAAACAAAPIIDLFAPGVGSTACAVATTAVVAASATCLATLAAGNLRGPMQEAIEFATERGVPIVTIAGNVFVLPEIIRDLVTLDDPRTERWEIIPAMMPQTIVAGASGDDWPFANIHFFGARVDLWAPIRSSYMAPSNTTAAAMSGPHVLYSGAAAPRPGIGGTSAAAPYIAGVVAAMQAVNPVLDPRTPGLTPAARRAIPDTIKTILANSAWTANELRDMAPADRREETADAGARRRNLINPFRAIQAAVPPGSMPARAASLGYPENLDFHETTPEAAADTRAYARMLTLGTMVTGTIIAITGEGGAPTLSDVDWFGYQISAVAGIYQAQIQLRVPRGFGHLFPGPADYTIEERAGTPDEAEFIISGPRLLAGATDYFELRGVYGSDNVYKLTLLAPRWVAPAPSADRFDVSNTAVNPPESRPNNNLATRAVRLGESTIFPELNWALAGSGPAGDIYEIYLPGLNFHSTTDVDWFEIRRFPSVQVNPDVPGCQPELEIEFAPGMVLTATTESGTVLVSRQRSVVRMPWRLLATPLRFRLEPEVPGRALSYNLRLRFRTSNDRICSYASLIPGIDGSLSGSRIFGFPGFLPELMTIDPTVFPGISPRQIDAAGRVTTPDTYLMSWNGSGTFTATFELLQGNSLRLDLLNVKGEMMATAATGDLLSGILVGLMPNPEPIFFTHSDNFATAAQGDDPEFEGRPVLVLTAEDLPPDDYILQVSYGTLDTLVLATLPAGATTDGSVTLEELLAGPPPAAPVLQAELGPNGLVLSWEIPLKPFVLESAGDLNSNQWSPVAQAPVASDGRLTVILPTIAQQQFFRLRLNE
jgi:hypothetical protein